MALYLHSIICVGFCTRVSDEILAECLTDVAVELEGINNDIVEHVYGAEFSDIPHSERGQGADGCQGGTHNY